MKVKVKHKAKHQTAYYWLPAEFRIDYFIVRILKSRVQAGEVLLTRENGNFLATGFLIWNTLSFLFFHDRRKA